MLRNHFENNSLNEDPASRHFIGAPKQTYPVDGPVFTLLKCLPMFRSHFYKISVCSVALTQACGECSQSRVSFFPAGSWTGVFCKHGTAESRCFSSPPFSVTFSSLVVEFKSILGTVHV